MAFTFDDYTDYINYKFISRFSESSQTEYSCTHCKSGNLVCDGEKVSVVETPYSKKERADECWELEWVKYYFSAHLVCNKCKESTFCVGTGNLEFYPYNGPEENAPNRIEECYELELTPTYFEPSIEIFKIPKRCPEKISVELNNAFKLAFSDFSAAGNRIRSCLELYIFELNPSATGSLHSKVESIKQSEPSVYELLMAVKWLGNEGTHEASLKEYDLAFAFTALQHCLEITYNSDQAQLKKLASLINSNKGSIVKT